MREHLLSPAEFNQVKVTAAADKITGIVNCFGAEGDAGYPFDSAEVRGFVNVLHGHVRQIVQHSNPSILDPGADLDGLEQLIYETIGPVVPQARIVYPPTEPVRMTDYAVSVGNAEFNPTRLAVATHGANGMYVYYETCARGVLLLDQMTWCAKKTEPDMVAYARAGQRLDVPLGFADFGSGQVMVLDDTASSAVYQTWMKDFCSGLSDLAQAVSPVPTF